MNHVLVTPESLAPRMGEPHLLVVDCRADIRDADKGRADYEAGHIPGAVYADLDRDLSDLSQTGALGRHPLPTDAALSAALSRWNLTPDRLRRLDFDWKGRTRTTFEFDWEGHRVWGATASILKNLLERLARL